MPKLIVLGTNDRYWPVDAVKLYYGDLEGEKYIHYVPNKGHGLGPGAIEAVSAFYNAVITKQPMPRFTWSFATPGGSPCQPKRTGTARWWGSFPFPRRALP